MNKIHLFLRTLQLIALFYPKLEMKLKEKYEIKVIRAIDHTNNHMLRDQEENFVYGINVPISQKKTGDFFSCMGQALVPLVDWVSIYHEHIITEVIYRIY